MLADRYRPLSLECSAAESLLRSARRAPNLALARSGTLGKRHTTYIKNQIPFVGMGRGHGCRARSDDGPLRINVLSAM